MHLYTYAFIHKYTYTITPIHMCTYICTFGGEAPHVQVAQNSPLSTTHTPPSSHFHTKITFLNLLLPYSHSMLIPLSPYTQHTLLLSYSHTTLLQLSPYTHNSHTHYSSIAITSHMHYAFLY